MATPPSATAAARWVPSGLRTEDMILPWFTTRRVPIGVMYWALGTTWPLAVISPTCWVPSCLVEAEPMLAPVNTSVTVATPALARRPRPPFPSVGAALFPAGRLRRVTCMEEFPLVSRGGSGEVVAVGQCA